MIIVLKNANFSASNIGTLSSWRITRSLGTGAAYEGATSVDKGAAFTATVTIAEGYELGAAGVTVTMGGNVISAAVVNGNTITISIAEVTGNVVIKVPTLNINTGEEEEPDVPGIPDIPTEDLLAVATFMPNTAVKAADGTTYTDNNFYTYTDIPVSAGDELILASARAVAFYNANKGFIGYAHLMNGSASDGYAGCMIYPGVLRVPNGVSYIAYCAKYADYDVKTREVEIGRPNADGSYTVDEVLVNTKDQIGTIISVADGSATVTLAVNTYFAILGIPVSAGQKYRSDYGRNYMVTDASGKQLGDATSFKREGYETLTVPANGTHLHVTFKYEDVSKANASVTRVQ